MMASASSMLSSIRDSEKLRCECCFSFEEEEEGEVKAKRTIFLFCLFFFVCLVSFCYDFEMMK